MYMITVEIGFDVDCIYVWEKQHNGLYLLEESSEYHKCDLKDIAHYIKEVQEQYPQAETFVYSNGFGKKIVEELNAQYNLDIKPLDRQLKKTLKVKME